MHDRDILGMVAWHKGEPLEAFTERLKDFGAVHDPFPPGALVSREGDRYEAMVVPGEAVTFYRKDAVVRPLKDHAAETPEPGTNIGAEIDALCDLDD